MSEISFYLRNEKYGFLSNFHRVQQLVEAKFYRTNEHFYQSKKALDPSVELWISNAPTPFLAMMAGRSLRPGKELRADWEPVKVEIMLKGLRAKFGQNNILRANLLSTGDNALHEDSNHKFWGKAGQDMLGRLLMQVRDELRRK